MGKKHLGSTLDSFLKEEGTYEETQAQASEEVAAWEVETERFRTAPRFAAGIAQASIASKAR